MARLQGFKSFEAVGVPSGLVDIASDLYDRILDGLESGNYDYELEDADPDEYKYPVQHVSFDMPIRYSGKINDYQIRRFEVRLSAEVVDYPDKSSSEDSLAGAAYGPTQRIDRKNFKVIYEDKGNISLMVRMRFSKPEGDEDDDFDAEYWQGRFYEILEKEKTEAIKSLGHELMHAYDLGHVKGGEGHKSSSKYAAYNSLRFGIRKVDEFFYYLYYTTRCESIVRNAEVASGMSAQGVDQDRFAEYLSSTETYRVLKEISKWTFDGFVADLKADLAKERSEVKQSLDSTGFPLDRYDDEEILEALLDMIVDNINRRSIDALIGKLQVPSFFGLSLVDPEDDATDEEKNQFLRSFADEAMKNIQDSEAYFRSKERFFHDTAGKLIKKLGKLYSLAKPSNVSPMHAKITAKGSRNESRIMRSNIGRIGGFGSFS